MTKKKETAVKMLTGSDEKRAGRTNVLLPESEFRYLYAILTEHEPLSDAGKRMIERMLAVMGKTLDKWNDADRPRATPD